MANKFDKPYAHRNRPTMKMDDAPTKKKEPIVSEKEFKEFNKSGDKTLRDFMNARKYSNAEGKFVERAKPLTRKKDTAKKDTTSSTPSKEEFDKSGYGTMEDYINNVPFSQQYKYDEKTKRFVERDKKLTEEEAMKNGSPDIDKMYDDEALVGGPSLKAEVYKPPKANPSETEFKVPKRNFKKGGSVKSKSKSASSRGDGIAQRGKTRA